MHPPSKHWPSQGQLVFPLLEELAKHGGSSRAKNVAGALADRFDLLRQLREERIRLSDGQEVVLWQRHVRFARQKALSMGYLEPNGHGVWALTDAGRNGIEKAVAAITVTIVTNDQGTPIGAQVDLSVGLPTVHTLKLGDARDLSFIESGQIPLVVTSVPYYDLKNYGRDPGQLALLPSYDAFLEGLNQILAECWRVIAPGGRFCCNVGDVLRSRKQHGSHHILPLHADILVQSRALGFQALNGILWHKIGNCHYEEGPGGILGQPGQPNQVIKLEAEHILIMKKPGPYRKPTPATRKASRISPDEQRRWYRQIWDDIPGTTTPRCACDISGPRRKLL